MTTVVFHTSDTIGLEAQIPSSRDFSEVDKVRLLLGESETTYDAAITDVDQNTVSVPLSTIDVQRGYYEIKWRLTYADGTTEVLPPEGDTLHVTE